jgi:hypothetical protein
MSNPSGFCLSCEYEAPGDFRTEVTAFAARLAQALSLPAPDPIESNDDFASVRLAPGFLVTGRHPDPEYWLGNLELFLGNVRPEDAPRLLRVLHAFMIDELGRGQVVKAEIYRTDSDANGYPHVPLLRKRHLFATTSKLEDYFEDTAACRACPDVSIETVGKYLLIVRALDAISDEDFLRASVSQCWQFARAARPGVVTYGEPPEIVHLDIYRTAPRRLQPVGYADGLAEYACYLEPDEHVAGWEIDGIAGSLKDGQLADGRALHTVRVAFANRNQAEREKRPLLDCGIKVVFMEQGSEHELTV